VEKEAFLPDEAGTARVSTRSELELELEPIPAQPVFSGASSCSNSPGSAAALLLFPHQLAHRSKTGMQALTWQLDECGIAKTGDRRV